MGANPQSLLLREIFLLGILYGVNYLLVSGAHAVVSMELLPDFFPGHLLVISYEIVGHHQKARRAVPALKCKILPEGLLLNAQLAIRPLKAFNGCQFGALGLHSKYLAGFDRLSVPE